MEAKPSWPRPLILYALGKVFINKVLPPPFFFLKNFRGVGEKKAFSQPRLVQFLQISGTSAQAREVLLPLSIWEGARATFRKYGFHLLENNCLYIL